ncbi:ABC transporter ATP-binding protein [Myxococcus xanthus]|uniref:ABC transporter ATP-binding protein n=1 Tax=Myxococcus xanthus TaxID=34 RepID=UPI00112D14BE|nr:ABC transporter ATP-binding protein [Myxococcus xanthus]QDE84910.1 ABC transporter permease [Myxococcus xanthus]QDE99062.1 ABC transporter permease [Myxococcus xanthus]
MLRELFMLGERLAGRKDARLRRGLLFALAEALAVAAPYALVLFFVREALEHRLSMHLTWWLTGGIAISVLLRLAFSIGAMSNIFVAAHALMGQARIRTADHLRRLPMGFFTQRRSGELAGVLTTDVALVEDVWSHTIGIFTASFALPMLVGLGLCFLDWRLGLVILAALPVALLVLAATTPLFVREFEAVLEASADVNARVVEYVQGIAVLRAFGRHGEVYQRFVKAMERLRDALIRADVLPSPLLAVFGFVVEMSFVAVAYAGSTLALRGSIQPGVLLVFLVVTVGVVRQVADLGVALLMLRASQRALGRVDGLLAEKPLAEPSARAASIQKFDVEVDAVSFAYEDETVLDGVSVTFPERSLTALVGASGSGKSTLVHLVARLWDIPRQGAIRIGGVDIRDIPFEELHQHIAMVFQDVVLFSGTILENLRVGRPDASLEEVQRAARAARAHDFITALPNGYDTLLGEGGGTLSGGERQRLSIARAILKDAPIVLLDEATASVDASAEAEIQRAIDELVRKKTVVVIAHRLRTVRRAHRIIVLDKGRVAESGTHDELLAKRGVYAALWLEQERAKGWRLVASTPSRATAEQT